MPTYYPIDIPVSLKASLSDLIAFRWETNGTAADFLVPGDDEVLLRVSFDSPCIIRILDEMALSTENDCPKEGLVSDHFAYRVEGSAFVDAQSEVWKSSGPTVAHYRFVTGWACMDVVTCAQPFFTVVSLTSARSA